MVLFYLFTFTFLFYQLNSTYDSNPSFSFQGSTTGSGNTIKISPKQNMIVAGFQDGNVKIFDIQSKLICSVLVSTPQNSSIIQVLWSENYGVITLDEDGNVAIMNQLCNISKRFAFPNTTQKINLLEIKLKEDKRKLISRLAVMSQNTIQQYDLDTFNRTLVYSNNGTQIFFEIIYASNNDKLFLLASTNTSFLRIFSIQNGSQTENSIQLVSPIYKMVKAKIPGGEVVIGLTQSNQLYRFTNTQKPVILGLISNSNANSVTICPSSKQLVLSQNVFHSLLLYMFSGNYQKNLTGINGIPQELDCSSKYLVSIDDTSFIQIYSISQFEAYIIGIIVGIAVGLVVLLVGAMAFIKLKAKYAAWKQAQKQNKEGSKYRQKNKQQGVNQSKNTLNNTLNTLTTQYN